ncbi:MAG TPA: hypothetical protein VG734_07390 [Lacunisphaera sp.]|nr:hypothetical protein [Lacunisphaera sp.]
MNCRDSESLILAERDGALTKDQLAGLSDHVAACPACRELRANLAAALEAYHADASSIPAPDVNEAWRELQTRLHGGSGKSMRKRPLAPVIWLGTPLMAAAALALVFLTNRPMPAPAPAPAAEVALSPAPYDSSVIAGADYVEAGDPNAATLVYVDKESGWLVVWATEPETKNNG